MMKKDQNLTILGLGQNLCKMENGDLRSQVEYCM